MQDERNTAKETESAGKAISTFMERMQQEGVAFFIDGHSVSPWEPAWKAVQEDCDYMADYIPGEDGSIKEIRFDKVTLQ